MTLDTTPDRAHEASYDPPRVSWAAFLAWHDGPTQAEWVDGEIVEMSPASAAHQRLGGFLYALLHSFVERHRLGELFYPPFLMRLPKRPSGREPDLLFVATRHADRIKDTYLDGPADLVVEIVSPDSEARDRREKLLEYEAAGVPEYWLLDQPRREAIFYLLDEDGRYRPVPLDADGIYTSAILPGFRLRVDWLWRSPLPTVDEAVSELRV